MTLEQPPNPPRRMPARTELMLRGLGVAAIAASLFTPEAVGRWLAAGGGFWLAGVYAYRAWNERPGPIGRHLFWGAVFAGLAVWLLIRP